jgi:carbonic anhydrase
MDRKKKLFIVLIAVLLVILLLAWKKEQNNVVKQKPLTQERQQAKTPQDVLLRLKAGNQRFMQEDIKEANFSSILETSKGSQFPAAIILSCIDSRVPPEIVFDQAIGNIFVSRVAGSVLNEDAIAGMEYSTHVVGAKLIVIMGHEDCGAIESACKGVKLGHITQLLEKITPAITQSQLEMPNASCAETRYIDLITKNNVLDVMKEIPQKSDIIRQDIADGKVMIVGAIYHTKNGEVEFLN